MRVSGFQALAALLCVLLAAPPAGYAQEAGGIRIVVLSGDGAIHNIDRKVVVEPVIEVQDAEGRPVPKAVVTFTAPATGPSITFFGASRTTTVTTDENGRARASGIVPNTETGAFQLEVEAHHGADEARATIEQANAVTPGAPKPRKGPGWRLLAALGAAAAAGIAAAALRGDDESVTTPTSVAVGGVTVGAPR